MPTHKRSLAEVSASELAELTGHGHRWLRARLAGLEPVRTDGRSKWYVAPEALRRIYVDEEHLDLAQERARLAKVQRELAALKLAEAQGELVQADRVARGWARIGAPHPRRHAADPGAGGPADRGARPRGLLRHRGPRDPGGPDAPGRAGIPAPGRRGPRGGRRVKALLAALDRDRAWLVERLTDAAMEARAEGGAFLPAWRARCERVVDEALGRVLRHLGEDPPARPSSI